MQVMEQMGSMTRMYQDAQAMAAQLQVRCAELEQREAAIKADCKKLMEAQAEKSRAEVDRHKAKYRKVYGLWREAQADNSKARLLTPPAR